MQPLFWADLNFVDLRDTLRSFAWANHSSPELSWVDNIITVECVGVNKSQPIYRLTPVTFFQSTPDKCLDSASNNSVTVSPLHTVLAHPTVLTNCTNDVTCWRSCIMCGKFWVHASSIPTILPHFVSFLGPFSVTPILTQTFGYIASCSNISLFDRFGICPYCKLTHK
jgi:hypothetical protein